MKVLISGANGFLGKRLRDHFDHRGDSIFSIQRVSSNIRLDNAIAWNIENGWLDLAPMENADLLIHLAGENIFGRWTAAKKARIRQSRLDGTAQLVEAISRLNHPPQILFSASASGFYGSCGNDFKKEHSPKGRGFLAELCADWEAAAGQAQRFGVRVLMLRLGVILDPTGGALKKMLLPFRLGFGGRFGKGDQYFPWIAAAEIPFIMDFLIRENVCGPINLVAPDCITNADFTKALARHLARPARLPFPKRLAQILFGEMADETLLASCRAIPALLQSLNYSFRYPTLQKCLDKILPQNRKANSENAKSNR